jgi:hypothetical protein
VNGYSKFSDVSAATKPTKIFLNSIRFDMYVYQSHPGISTCYYVRLPSSTITIVSAEARSASSLGATPTLLASATVNVP